MQPARLQLIVPRSDIKRDESAGRRFFSFRWLVTCTKERKQDNEERQNVRKEVKIHPTVLGIGLGCEL